jgi:predicted  nucleic acid-binding Zn-ribbon protein
MSEDIQRSIGRIEGEMKSFNGKMDSLIAALANSEVTASRSRDQISNRLGDTETKLIEVQDELHAVARKVDAIEPRITNIEPEIEQLRKLRIQGLTVVATLTFLGSLVGVSLFSLKDRVLAFFGIGQ